MTRLLAACLTLAFTLAVAGCADSPGRAQPAPRSYGGGYGYNPMGGGGG